MNKMRYGMGHQNGVKVSKESRDYLCFDLKLLT